MGDETYQSLYRRFRPGRFAEVLGQEHVTTALRNAVATDRIGHAYLFSGPRGTGKTSTARILAKALNCASLEAGEPCGACDSCRAVARGASLDVHELDAASNNGVEAMRDLVARAALATPGKWKVYIVDEVHMLSTAASNALLKTLEEPPGQVVFILATTDPQKVLPTIRSRTQHFEFHLLPAELLDSLVAQVVKDAGLDVPDEVLPSVVRRARGSARDALSALDQAAAAGMLDDTGPHVEALAAAVAGRDTAGALSALDAAIAGGRDPQVLASELLERMRAGFLATFAPDLAGGDPAEVRRIADSLKGGGLAALVRAMETIGRAQVEMRAAVDPRVTLEVALVRVTRPEVDASPEAILERLERLERGGGSSGGGSSGGGSSGGGGDGGSARPVAPTPPEKPRPPATEARPVPRPPARTEASPSSSPGSAAQTLTEKYGTTRRVSHDAAPTPSREELTKAWGDGILASLSTKARARFKVGRFVDSEEGTAAFALPNEVHRGYCEGLRGEVQAALGAHFGVPIELVLIVDPDAAALAGVLGVPAGPSGATASVPPRRSAPVPPPEDESSLDPSQLLDEEQVRERAAALVLEFFPGAVELPA